MWDRCPVSASSRWTRRCERLPLPRPTGSGACCSSACPSGRTMRDRGVGRGWLRAARGPGAGARAARSGGRHRRLPLRIHVAWPLRAARRRAHPERRDGGTPGESGAFPRRGRRAHRRAVRHDGRACRRDPRRARRLADSTRWRSCPTRPSTARRSTARFARRPGRRRRSGTGGATRWIRRTSTKRCAKSSSIIEEGADIVMVKPALPYLDVVCAGEARVRRADGRVSRQWRVRDAQGSGAPTGGSTNRAR